jgi:FkbM family methyltransferase
MRRLERRLKLWVWGHRRTFEAGRRLRLFGRYLLRRPHEPDFAVFAGFPDRTGLFLDVGANAGQSALSFRIFNRRCPILSIEPLALNERDLRVVRRLIRGFDYMICAAGDKDSETTLYVPASKRTPITPEASLRREVAEACYWISQNFESPPKDDFEILRVPIQVRRLDALALSPDFIKIDVEGCELSVVRGLARTISRHQPLMLVEAPEKLDEILGLEALEGYRPFVFLPETGKLAAYASQATTNVVLLPEGVHSPDMGRGRIRTSVLSGEQAG